ncbi:MAG TPA: GIY-YIG nuclease family protein [Chitinophagales bacterium]|nr:GIY-YIG nuclease family protein [Chitinophagales bacterium]
MEGKICYYFYKLVCNDTNITDFYIGSTGNFKQRIRNHRNICIYDNDYYLNKRCYVHKFIVDHGGWDNWKVILIEMNDYQNKMHALKRERVLIEEMKPTLNMVIPIRSREEIKECIKKYRNENKNEINEKRRNDYKNGRDLQSKIYYENNKDKIIKMRKMHYENNKDKLLKEKRKYREINAEKIKASKSALKTCDICSKQITSSHLARHKRIHVD